MRTAYHEQLDALTNQLAEMCRMAGIAMERATQALLQADLVMAEQVIGDHEKISHASARAEETAFVLLALQAPVAGDLRAIVSSIQIAQAVTRRLGCERIDRAQHPLVATPRPVCRAPSTRPCVHHQGNTQGIHFGSPHEHHVHPRLPGPRR